MVSAGSGVKGGDGASKIDGISGAGGGGLALITVGADAAETKYPDWRRQWVKKDQPPDLRYFKQTT